MHTQVGKWQSHELMRLMRRSFIFTFPKVKFPRFFPTQISLPFPKFHTHNPTFSIALFMFSDASIVCSPKECSLDVPYVPPMPQSSMLPILSDQYWIGWEYITLAYDACVSWVLSLGYKGDQVYEKKQVFMGFASGSKLKWRWFPWHDTPTMFREKKILSFTKIDHWIDEHYERPIKNTHVF